jgi:hypothetical protein
MKLGRFLGKGDSKLIVQTKGQVLSKGEIIAILQKWGGII